MKYPQFNGLGLSDDQVDEVRDCLFKETGFAKTRIDDDNLQFVVYEKMNGVESRGLLLKIKTKSARFHFMVNLWGRPGENGRLKLKGYLEDKGANRWQFNDARIDLMVRNKKGDQTRGNVFYFVPSDVCHCKVFSIIDVYKYRDTLSRLAKSILDKLHGVGYFTVDYSGCRLAKESDSAIDISHEVDGNAVTIDDYHKMMLKNGGTYPVKVPVDVEKWRQADYGDDVRPLSELRAGVISWVSTVEDVAKKAPIKVNGFSVMPAKFRIPPYQRKFAWKEQDVRLLCKDLLRAGDDGHYHLGTVVLHHERISGEDIWNVVDGQQRLTNIMAILHAPIFVVSDVGYVEIKQFLVRDYAMICHVLDEYSESERRTISERLTRCTLAFISVENVCEAFQLFTTQNGRGKPLTPVNLLKAYHYKEMELDRASVSQEEFDRLQENIEKEWESANTTTIATAPGDGKLLLHVFKEYLFRLRLWCRGKFPQLPFNASNISEFKGVTIKQHLEGLPLQNAAILRTGAKDEGEYIAHRIQGDNMNPYVAICQTIVNGADFFKYAQSYVEAYKDVFVEGKVETFHKFYNDNCGPKKHKSGAAMYARHVFEALCMFCYDRFGGRGLDACCRPLFACAYYERVAQSRVLYRRCGSLYAPKAIEAMMTVYSVEDAREALNALRSDICTQLNATDYVKELLKKTKLTQGEMLQRAAYVTIMK